MFALLRSARALCVVGFVSWLICSGASVLAQTFVALPKELAGARAGEQKEFSISAKNLSKNEKQLALFYRSKAESKLFPLGEASLIECREGLCFYKIKISNALKYFQVPQADVQLAFFSVTPVIEVVDMLDKNKLPESPNSAGSAVRKKGFGILWGMGAYNYDELSDTTYNFYKFTRRVAYPKHLEIRTFWDRYHLSYETLSTYLPTRDVFENKIDSNLSTKRVKVDVMWNRDSAASWNFGASYLFESENFETENTGNEVIIPSKMTVHSSSLIVKKRFRSYMYSKVGSEFKIPIGDIQLIASQSIKGKVSDVGAYKRGEKGALSRSTIDLQWRVQTEGAKLSGKGWLIEMGFRLSLDALAFEGNPAPTNFTPFSTGSPRSTSGFFKIGREHVF